MQLTNYFESLVSQPHRFAAHISNIFGTYCLLFRKENFAYTSHRIAYTLKGHTPRAHTYVCSISHICLNYLSKSVGWVVSQQSSVNCQHSLA